MLVNDPNEIEHVLVGNAGNYRKSAQQQRRLRPALGDGLLTAEGAAWQGARKIAAPLFNPRTVAGLLDDMLEASAVMRDRWLDRAGAARPLDLAAEFQRLTYEIVSRTVFSGALDQDRARVHANMAIYFETLGRLDLASLFSLPAWLPTPSALRARPALAIFRSIVDRIVAQRTADPEREASDLLDRLMRSPFRPAGLVMTPTLVADNVLTFLAAGHETTGNALAWILYLLALFPDTESAVTEELLSVLGNRPSREGAFDKLVFTRAVVNEALRLYPPAPFMGREAVEGDDLAGRRIAKGTQVLICRGSCTAIAGFGTSRRHSGPSASWPRTIATSRAAPSFRSASVPAFASAGASRSKKSWRCWRPSCQCSIFVWSMRPRSCRRRALRSARWAGCQ